jgi:mono/diheme cytochrome c family protein
VGAFAAVVLGTVSGWAVRWASAADGAREVTEHSEHAAFAVRDGEAPHPEAGADALRAIFEGEVKVGRAGRYRFGIDGSGGSGRLEVGERGISGRTGFRDEGVSSPGASAWTDWIELGAGAVRVSVAFERAGSGAARVRTWWEMQPREGSAGFGAEPIPARAVSVPAMLEAAVQREQQARRGRVLLSELGCVNCHEPGPAAAVLRRAPISLERVAARADEGWLRRWMLAPQAIRPGCGMPELLDLKPEPSGEGIAGAAASGDPAFGEVEALAELLKSLAFPGGAPAQPAETADPFLAAQGRELYHSVGCVACHGPFDSPAAAFGEDSLPSELPAVAAPAPLRELDGKWRIGELAAFLREPRTARPHGRMPSLGLTEPEAAAMAHFLAGRFGTAPAAEAFQPDAARIERGKAVFRARGCASCHTLGAGLDEPKGETEDGEPPAGATPAEAPAPTPRPFTGLADDRGCLAADAASRGEAPRYALSEALRGDLRAGIESARRARGAPAPMDVARRALAAFQCTACHERGVAEPPPTLLPYFRCRVETDLGDEGRLPPRLDGVGFRLQSPWLARVIASGESARPYLATRMPRFGDDVAALLVDGLAAIEGEWRSDAPHLAAAAPQASAPAGSSGPSAPPADPAAAPRPAASFEEMALAGRKLAGTGGLNCITCHSFGARPSAGTPGLDFTQFETRLRKEWWRRYALAPLRFKPGTRMPTYFEGGRSAAVALLDGDAAAQIDALWAWFERASTMPVPEGVPSGERMVLDVGGRPRVFRTFLARAGNRGIAVGFPDGLHFAFDAEQVRLCEAWSGEFLDVAPVWTGRGGNVAPQLGPVVWSALPGPALLLAGRVQDPFEFDPWPADSGRNHGVKFRGYRLEADGSPTFLHELRDPSVQCDAPPQPDAVQVEERFVPDPRPEVVFKWMLRLTNFSPDVTVLWRPDLPSAKVRIASESGGSLRELTSPGGRVIHAIAPQKQTTAFEVVFEILQ